MSLVRNILSIVLLLYCLLIDTTCICVYVHVLAEKTGEFEFLESFNVRMVYDMNQNTKDRFVFLQNFFFVRNFKLPIVGDSLVSKFL